MADIDQLNSQSTPASGDLVPIYSKSNGEARKITFANMLAWFQSNLSFATSQGVPESVTVYASPAATGFSVAFGDTSYNQHLILMPIAGYAEGTIVLPSVGNAGDKQRVLVNCTQAVTALTIDGNGAVGVHGAPTTLAAGDFFELKYDSLLESWFRIG